MRAHIFVDRDEEAPEMGVGGFADARWVDKRHRHDRPTVAVTDRGEATLAVCRKVLLRGSWTLRQYRNPVPCGATIVLYPTDDRPGGVGGTYEVESYV